MTLLEWLIILPLLPRRLRIWSVLERRRERAPYRAKKPRRTIKFTVLTLLLIGLGLTYNSASVQNFFQKPADTRPVDLTVEPTVELRTYQREVLDAPLVLEKSSLKSQANLSATLPSQPIKEINLLVPPLITPESNAESTNSQTFNLSFQSDPPSATLYLGGKRVGVTPLNVVVAAGQSLPYTLRTERGVPNYQLYHAYSGEIAPTQDTALSIWLERLDGREVAALYQEIRPQPQPRHISASTVRYEISTDCGAGLDLTYTDKQQRVVQEKERLSGWAYGFMPKPEQFLYLYAKNNCGAGHLNVQIVQNDGVWQEDTASREGAIATVSGYWQD